MDGDNSTPPPAGAWPPKAPPPPRRTDGRRSRLRDWWRWVPLIPILGPVGTAIGLIRRKRALAALVFLLGAAGDVALIAVGTHQHEHAPAYDPNRGVGYLSGAFYLWLFLSIGAWALPTGRPPRRPWPQATEKARHFTARYGLGAYAIAFGLVILLTIVFRATGARLGVAASVISVDVILLAGLVPLIRRAKLKPRDLGLRSTKAGPGAGLAVAALILYLGLTVVYSLLFIHASNASTTASKQYNIFSGTSGLTTFLDCFALAISAPVCEEIFFRGLLYRCLRNRLSVWPAALIAGSLFGLVHITSYPLDTIPIKMLFGVLMCLLYEQTGSLLPTIAVHCAVDGSAADAIFTGNLDIAGIVLGSVLVLVLIRAGYESYLDGKADKAAFFAELDAAQAALAPAAPAAPAASIAPPAPAGPSTPPPGRLPW